MKKFAEIQGKQKARDAEIERAAETRFATRVAAIRKEATATAKADFAGRLAKAEQGKKAAEQQTKSLRSTFEATLSQRLAAQAETAAKDRDSAVNAVAENHMQENLRLQAKVHELQRALEKKSANERGDEGEVNLLGLLQSVPEFAEDTWERVKKGAAGPDITQTVINNGISVGRIVYDSKNTKKWNGAWTRKLRQDAIALEAEHAVLVAAASAFPAGEQHLLYRDGVMVLTRQRLVPVVHLMRRMVTQLHAQKLVSQDRNEKADRLFLMMTSARVSDLWDRHAQATQSLDEIERSDAAWQHKTRGRRTELINDLRTMVDQEFLASVSRIIAGSSVEASP